MTDVPWIFACEGYLADEALKSGDGTLFVQRTEHVLVCGAEALIVHDSTKDVSLCYKRVDVVPVLHGDGVQLRGETIDDLDGGALLVYALVIPSPAGNDRGRQFDIATGGNVVSYDGHKPFRDSVGALSAQAGNRVGDVLVAETVEELELVGVEVDTWQRRQGRCRLLVHISQQETRKQRVARHIVHRGVAGEVAEVAQALVTRVEQT